MLIHRYLCNYLHLQIQIDFTFGGEQKLFKERYEKDTIIL